MKIEILGTGCPKCKMLETNAKKALEESGKKAEIVKVTEIEKIVDLKNEVFPIFFSERKIASLSLGWKKIKL